MEVRLHEDLAAFTKLALPLLHVDPVRHTIAVTLLRSAKPEDVATMLTVHEGAVLRGAAMRMRGWGLLTSALPIETIEAVADVLVRHDSELAGAAGPRQPTEAFAAAWTARTETRTRVAMAQRLFALGQLMAPPGVPGRARVATTDDLPLLAAWRREFEAAALPAGWPRPDDAAKAIARSLAVGNAYLLWEVDGRPVAVAAVSAPAADMSRIGPVWTPPSHRRNGFGSAVTAAASRWALDAGARHVVLFTDLANPVSNSIYPKIGYRPVHDALDVAFDPAG